MMEHLNMQSMDKVAANVAKIRELFPNCVTERINNEGKLEHAIDFDMLKQELSDHVVDGLQERYQFTWPDKRKAILAANAPINKTLRPCREESVDFDNTENLYIEGDNLEVLKLLQETYLGKVKMIYIDPPYNTGRNLLYKNNFYIDVDGYKRAYLQKDDEGNRLVQNLESNGRFHTDWLNMMYTRLKIAKDLLKEEGVLVCAIDENEVATLMMMLKELFLEDRYDHTLVTVVHNPRGQQGTNFSYTNEYAIFIYPKGMKIIADRRIAENDVSWSQFRNWGSESLRSDAKNCFYPIIVKNGEIIGFGDVCEDNYHPNQTEREGDISYVYPIDRNGIERKWRYARQSVEIVKNMLRAKEYLLGFEIEIGKTFGVQKTVWNDKKYDANEYGTKIVSELLKSNIFTFPKSVWNVFDVVCAGCLDDKNSLILDFFSGSATTAHAVMQLNAEDGGKRKFIMVQLPEVCAENSEAYKAGYKNICEIGKERIRRAGQKIKEENPLTTQDLDIGFRVLKCDSSNMEDVYFTPKEYMDKQQSLFIDNIKKDRSDEDLLFDAMLKLDTPLSSKIEKITIAGKTVYNVAQGHLMACFDKNVTDEVITAIAKEMPSYFVMRDSSQADDSVAINFEQIFNTYSPQTVRRVL